MAKREPIAECGDVARDGGAGRKSTPGVGGHLFLAGSNR